MSGTITVTVLVAVGENNGKNVIFKSCAPLTDCIIKINSAHVDDAKNIEIVMPMHNLIEYSDDYLNTSGNLWQ